MSQLLSTFFFAGYLRPASGTWASVIATILAVLAAQAGAPLLVVLGAVLATIVGFWAVPRFLGAESSADPSEVVIDEVAGQWIALSFTFVPLWRHGVEIGFVSGAWPAWVVPLVLFRFFDIFKPWLVGRADRRGDPQGVMLDDIWAGLFAGIVSVMLAGVYHLVMEPWIWS